MIALGVVGHGFADECRSLRRPGTIGGRGDGLGFTEFGVGELAGAFPVSEESGQGRAIRTRLGKGRGGESEKQQAG